MKTAILITTLAALLLSAGTARAESPPTTIPNKPVEAPLKGYTTFEYASEHNRDTDRNNIKGTIITGLKTSDGMDYSIAFEASQAELGNGSIGSLVEVRARKTFGKIYGNIKPYVGARLGEKISSKEAFPFYAVDAGIKFPIAEDFSGNVGVRYRNSFEDHNFETIRPSATVSYSISEHNSVGLGYNSSFGDEGKNAWTISYTREF